MNTLQIFLRTKCVALMRRSAAGAAVLAACWLVTAIAVRAQDGSSIALSKDGKVIEAWPAPAGANGSEAAAREIAQHPESFSRMIASELASDAVGLPPSPEHAERQAALRGAGRTLEELRDHVRALRASPTGARGAAARGELQRQRGDLNAAFQRTRAAQDGIGEFIVQRGLAPEILARHRAAGELAERNHAALLAALDDVVASGTDAALARLAAAVEETTGAVQPLPPAGPTVQTDWTPAPMLTRAEADALLARSAAQAGLASGGVTLENSESPETLPTPADLAATIEVQLSATITAQAAALGNSPQRIFEFVRGQIGFQPYLGSRKGAEETLRQRNGNDTDQASLLIALLRAAGIPSRYVRGTVEMTPAKATNWLGVDHAATAGSILTTAGMDGVNIIDGSTVVAIRCTRVWVEAYVPYSNYRGVQNSSLGATWVPLDPAFKGTILTPGQDVLAAMGFNTDTFLDAYISTFHPLSPLEQFAADIQTYLNGAQPGTTVAQIERRTTLSAPDLGLLPASLPATLRAVSSRFSELEDSKRYKVRFRLYNGGTTFIDYTTNLSQIAGHRVTFDYVGATPADQTTIDSFGGVYQTPPSLVNVKPRLKLDGNVLVASTNAIGLARTHNTDMHFLHPTGASNVQPLIQNTIIAGNSQAIAFDTFLDAGESGLFPSTLPTPGLLESLLHSTAAEYLNRVDRGEEQAGRLLRVVTTQDVSEAIVESAVKVSYSFGVPVTFEWGGLIVDADRRIVGTFAVDGNAAKHVPYMKLTGYDGSTMENRVFEDLYNQRAVSTIKILELSSDAGIPWYRITTSIAADAPGLSQPASVVSAINNALAQGHHVIVPRTGITVGQWSGTGYIDLTPSTGAAGYIISGGISGAVATSGGATVDVWPINLGCAPIGPVTGTITPSGFSNGDKLCPDSGQITYSVQLEYDCKDSSGAVVHKTFGPTSHTVPKTKLQIVEIYGAGVYTISIPGTAVAPVNFTLVDVDSVTPDKGSEVDDKDGDANTKTYVVAFSKTAGDKVTVNAKSKPVLAEADLPACWTLTGGTGAGKLQRTVDQTVAALTPIKATSGARSKTSTIAVVKVEFKPDAACAGFDDSVDPAWIMVPKGATNTAKEEISPATALALVKLESSDTAKVTVAPVTAAATPQTITLTGVAKGNTAIVARPDGAADKLAELKVAVKDKVNKKVAIHAMTEENDDVQTIPVGKGKPGQVCITAGANAALNTAPAGDDVVSGTSITTGPDGVCNTAKAGDDVQAIAVGKGLANAVGVSKGVNNFRDTKPTGDDVVNGDDIDTGPDGICNTAANATNLVPVNVPTAAALEAYLNDTIWGKQANVYCTVTRADFTVNYDLDRDGKLDDPYEGPPGTPKVPNDFGEVNVVRTKKDAAVDINIYYVLSYEFPIGLTVAQEIFTEGKGANSIVNHTAHEVGHALGRNGESNDVKDVMYKFGDPGNPCRVTKIDWDLVNP